MHKTIKIILIILVTILLCLLLSPVISLFLPEKLTNHVYYRLLYHVIVDKETAGCQNNEEKAIRLFDYVVNHEFMQGEPFKCKPAESLIYAEAYCDFQSRTLNVLLEIAGIPCRYAMLLDKENISRHTLNEVFLDNKWCVFSLFMNNIYKDDLGNKLSLEQLSNNPSLIYNQKKFTALKAYDKKTYDYWMAWYSKMFPMPFSPKRSIPVIYQRHIFDYIIDGYFKIFKYSFFNFYQDLYLNFKKNYSRQPDFKLFFIARNYHLAYRIELAIKYYNLLLKEYPQSKYTEDVIFFSGKLYFKMKHFYKAVEFFKLILDKYSGKWKDASYYYLGMAYGLMGNKKASLTAYSNSTVYKLSTQTLQELIRYGFGKN